MTLGCTTKTLPPRHIVIERVDIAGSDQLDDAEIKRKIATSATERIFRGTLEGLPVLGVVDQLTVEYHTFDRIVLQRDLERIRRYYRSRGFYEAQVTAGRVVRTSTGRLRVEIDVVEGEPVLIETIELDFPQWEKALEANQRMQAVVNKLEREPRESHEEAPRFDEQRYEEAKIRLRKALWDSGYAYAAVNGKVRIDVDARRAHIVFQAIAGPKCTFGAITIAGRGELPEDPIRDALGFEPEEQFSSAKIAAAQQALVDFGVFGSVEIIAVRSKPGEPRTTALPVDVVVTPIKLRAFKAGVGAEIGNQLEAHAVAGWESRNFLGGLRRFNAELRPGLVLFPTRIDNLVEPMQVLPEAQLRLHFTQPGFPEARTNTHLASAVRAYSPDSVAVPDEIPDDYNILGYYEVEGAAGVDRLFRFPQLNDSTFHAGHYIKLRFDHPFSYSLNVDEPPAGYERVLIPYFESIASWDFRKNHEGKPDPIRPARGVYVALDAQFAGGLLQGDSSDVRLRPELRLYAPMTKTITVAVRWASGFLFAYGDSTLVERPTDELTLARYLQLLSFRGFYSGGPNSNRGYGYRGVGPHEVLPFVSQSGRSDERVPTGGFGMWELSAELRIPLADKISMVAFVDSSDVVPRLNDFRLNYPHISPGLGLRFFTAVGPVRFDLGCRVPYLQQLGEEQLLPEEGGPDPGESEVPLGFSLAIGEAY